MKQRDIKIPVGAAGGTDERRREEVVRVEGGAGRAGGTTSLPHFPRRRQLYPPGYCPFLFQGADPSSSKALPLLLSSRHCPFLFLQGTAPSSYKALTLPPPGHCPFLQDTAPSSSRPLPFSPPPGHFPSVPSVIQGNVLLCYTWL